MSHITTHFFTIYLSLAPNALCWPSKHPLFFSSFFPDFSSKTVKPFKLPFAAKISQQPPTPPPPTHPTDCSQYLEQLFYTLLFKIPDMGFAPCGYTCEYFCVYVSLRLSLKLTSIVSSLRIANRSPTLICKPHKDFNTRVSANKSTRKRSKSRQGN